MTPRRDTVRSLSRCVYVCVRSGGSETLSHSLCASSLFVPLHMTLLHYARHFFFFRSFPDDSLSDDGIRPASPFRTLRRTLFPLPRSVFLVTHVSGSPFLHDSHELLVVLLTTPTLFLIPSPLATLTCSSTPVSPVLFLKPKMRFFRVPHEPCVSLVLDYDPVVAVCASRTICVSENQGRVWTTNLRRRSV